jgi:RNA exonuclease 4
VQVQAQVSEMLEGRVLVGHSVKNDLEVLLLGHPAKMLRDTARWEQASAGEG